MRIVLTSINAFPNKFSPLHFLIFASFSPRPMPHIVSYGDASTKIASFVSSNAYFNSVFCENFSIKPLFIISYFFVSQTD